MSLLHYNFLFIQECMYLVIFNIQQLQAEVCIRN